MPDHSIIPREINGFNLYLALTNAHLILGSPTNAVRFGWTSQNLSDWQAFETEWNPLYFLYSNRKESYTTAIKTKLETIITKALIYDRENKLILKVKATVGLTPDDCIIFKIPKSYAIPVLSPHQAAIITEPNKTIVTTEGVFAQLIPVMGGFVQVKCSTESTNSGRPRKLKGYDLVEYAVAVFYKGTANLPTHDIDKRLDKAYSSKAGFIIKTADMTTTLPVLAEGAIEPSKIAVFFFRWAKSKHSDLDGPWSGPYTTPLL